MRKIITIPSTCIIRQYKGRPLSLSENLGVNRLGEQQSASLSEKPTDWGLSEQEIVIILWHSRWRGQQEEALTRFHIPRWKVTSALASEARF
ncbi:unnamed protein product [Lupinus luteus]|uniref:Uncharacterized protein n=1 Tax=Lupinus luteus TaxID=3873 RepID=A0AAV1Y344_LUPLU